jgi:hypothetical protein
MLHKSKNIRKARGKELGKILKKTSVFTFLAEVIVLFKEENRLEISILSFSTHLHLPVKTMKLLIIIRDLFFSL